MIHVRELHKVYPATRGLLEVLRRPFERPEGVHALRGIDVDVEPGEVFGLLGPNGAGKTTFQKILVNLVLPTSGEVEIAGLPLAGNLLEIRRRVGWIPSDERSFFWRLSGLRNLRFFAALYEIPPDEAERRIQRYLERFDLARYAHQPFSIYSSGRKKMFTIVRGLLSEAPILVFDETTNSLDPPAAHEVMTHVQSLAKEEGRTVVWATHRLEEVRDICDRVLLIDGGESKFCGTTADFVAAAGDTAEGDDGLRSLTRVFQELVG